ncbi:hypothetical protein B0H13DRAFT_1964187 [Mycena leptocephala]|nr:hypothetical protein B0H13DRAFT_1964187 [Mycena leptocephala]
MQRLPPPLATKPEAIWAQPWPQAPEYSWRRALESLSRSAKYSQLREGHFNHATSAPAHESLTSLHLNQLLHGPNLGSRQPHATHASRVSPCSIRPDAADWTPSIWVPQPRTSDISWRRALEGLSRCQPKRRTRCDVASQRDDQLLRAPHLSSPKTAWSLSSAASAPSSRTLAPAPSPSCPQAPDLSPAVDSWYEHTLCDWTPPLCQGSLVDLGVREFENARNGARGWKGASGIAPGVAAPAFDPHTHGLQNEHFDGDLFTEPYYGEILPVLRYQVAATM